MVVAAGFTQIWPAFAAPAVLNTDLNSYSLFALDKIDLKGGNGQTSTFAGNIGVKNADPNPNSGPPSLKICAGGNGNPVKFLDGYQVVADTVETHVKCDYFDLFANQVNIVPTVRNSQQTWTPPLPMNIPDPGPFACNPNNPSVVTKNQTATIPPGIYGDANWQDGSTITLQAGVYVFCDIHGGGPVTINTEPGVDIRIANTFSVGNGSYFGGACDVKVFVRGDDNAANDVNFARNSTVWGTFMAPNGETALGHGTDLHGRFWGKGIHDDFDVNIDICTPDTPTTTTSTTTSTTTTTVPETTTSTTSTTTTTVPETTTTTTVPETTTTTTVPETTTTTTVPETTTTTATSTTTTTTTVPETTTTTTVPETTTTVTVPDTTTTTTVPLTTTSVADSTTIATTSTTTIPESTTIVTEGSTVTSSTTVPSSVTTQAVTTTTVAPILPFTGNGGWAPMLGLAAFAFGGALLFLTRKRNPRRV
jgi:hypothetical protein